MARKQPRFEGSYVEGLTTLRPGVVEHQPDAHRDEMFSDPTPYFSLKQQFGLHRSDYEKYQGAQKPGLLGVPEGPSSYPRDRTRGIKGPAERDHGHYDASPVSRRTRRS